MFRAVQSAAQFCHLNDFHIEHTLDALYDEYRLEEREDRWSDSNLYAAHTVPFPLVDAFRAGFLSKPSYYGHWIEYFADRFGVACALCGAVEFNSSLTPRSGFACWVAPRTVVYSGGSTVAPICGDCYLPLLRYCRRVVSKTERLEYRALDNPEHYPALLSAALAEPGFAARAKANEKAWAELRFDPRTLALGAAA